MEHFFLLVLVIGMVIRFEAKRGADLYKFLGDNATELIEEIAIEPVLEWTWTWFFYFFL